ncbi:cation:proton antiporter [Patescibacteria group bacterium]|nr:cation:proton antiporter [Patescibacteria group bacterium]MBU1906585.1 cation:proton antiporter [Patescibacteria group bacterium]
MLDQIFFQVGLVLVVAAAASLAAFKLRQPLMIGYIIAGVIIGPSVFAFAGSSDVFAVMSEIGVAFLLFTVGLSLNFRKVKQVGGIALASGIGQVVFTTVLGYLIGLLVGLDQLSAFYLALAFSFSSTIIIVKLLADQDDLDRLYGRIAVGFLIVQDIIAMIVLLVLGALGSGVEIQNIVTLTLGKGVFVLVVIWLLATRVVPKLVAYAAKSLELLFLFSIGWCFAIAGLLHLFGFGIEIGALLAGVSLSGTVYHNEIIARIRPLRDFFLIIFFIILGARLDVADIDLLIVPIIAFSIFILIGNPLIVMGIMRLLKYHPRTSFLTGNTVGQISEFGFIVLAAGVVLGHISPKMNTLAVFVGLITIAGSAYMMKYSEYIYDHLHWALKWLEPKDKEVRGVEGRPKGTAHTTLIGFNRIGRTIFQDIQKMGHAYRVIDVNPQAIEELTEKGVDAYYGDAGDDQFLSKIKIEKSKMIISTVPDIVINTDLLSYLRRRKYQGIVIVTARNSGDAEKCYAKGADFVIVPNVLGAERFGQFLGKKKVSKRAWASAAPKKRGKKLKK